jgi:hypothetical protein
MVNCAACPTGTWDALPSNVPFTAAVVVVVASLVEVPDCASVVDELATGAVVVVLVLVAVVPPRVLD